MYNEPNTDTEPSALPSDWFTPPKPTTQARSGKVDRHIEADETNAWPAATWCWLAWVCFIIWLAR